MEKSLRILILEDNPHDAELEVAVLEAAGYACQWERVETRAAFLTRLETCAYDLIFADYNLPSFDGLSALGLVKQRDIDTPIILISGTLGEERAIESLKAGATDYVLKTRLARLVPVVERALRERQEQRQRRHAEEAVQESERRFRTLASHAPVGIFLADPAGDCVFVNQRWCAMAGLDADAAKGRGWTLAIHPEDHERVSAEWYAAAQAGRDYLSEYRFWDPKGRITWLHARATALRDETGRITGYLGTVTDVTAHKRVEDELRRVNQLKADFVATMSHELRTPLNVIMGYNELLLDGAFGLLAAEQIDPLQKVGKSARDLLDLINAILDLNRLERGQSSLDLLEIRLADLVDELDAELHYAEIKPAVRLLRDIPPNLPPLHADRYKLKMVLRNLMANAFKFTDSGTVTIAARAGKDGTLISVHDTGIGIEPEILPTIFDPFRQGESSMTRRFGGVGLGLYVVRRLLDVMGGTITVESEVGRGTRFHVQLR